MNYTDIMSLIQEVEGKFPVNEWTIEGVRIWPLIRINLASKLTYSHDPTFCKDSCAKLKKKNRTLMVLKGLAKSTWAYLADFRSNAHIFGNKDCVFLAHTTSRLFKIDGKFFDVFIDPVVSNLKKSFLILEYAPNDEYRLPRYSKTHFIQYHLYISAVINKLRTIINSRKRTTSFNQYEAFLQFIDSKGIETCYFVPKKIINDFNYINLLSKYFEKILKKVRAQKAYVVCYYGQAGMAFNLACSRRGVDSIDIQHGTQAGVHVAYNGWTKVPEQGYELLPANFWCWSNLDVENINKWSKSCHFKHLAYVGGNLCLELFKGNNNITQYFDSKILNILETNLNKPKILMTLQPGIGLTEILQNVLSRSRDDWFWWIRLHPSMKHEFYNISDKINKINIKNFYIDDATSYSIYSVLRNIDVHLTYHSSTVIEAEQFNVPSVICNADAKSYYQQQINNNMADVKICPNDIVDSINDFLKREKNV